MALPIPASFIEELLASCNIVEIMQRMVPTLNVKGKSHCPFHHENTPSFIVNADKQFYYCFGCKASGNVISFIMQYERLNFVEAVQWLANDLQISLPNPSTKPQYKDKNTVHDLYQVMEQALLFYQKELQNSQIALRYLEDRNISNKTIATFKLGFAPPKWDGLLKALHQQHPTSALQAVGLIISSKKNHYYDRFRGRIIFPILDQRGRCIGFGGRALFKDDEPKYLNSPETAIYHKKNELYGLFEATRNKEKLERIWMVEGYMDVLSLHQSGHSNVVATLGTATNHMHLKKLFQMTEEVIFCFDGDEAGHQASMRALETSFMCLQEGWSIRFLLLPKGEDPDSWINQNSHHSLDALLPKTLSLSQFLFQKMQYQLDLNTPEGKSKLIQRTLPVLKKLSATFMREKLLAQLGHLVNTDPQHLTRILFKPPSTQYQTFKKPTISSLQNRAISFLIQYPQLFRPHITTALLKQINPHYPLLYDVLNCIKKNSPNNTAILLEYFREQPDRYHHLGLLAQHNWLLDETELLEEFQEIFIRLEQGINKKIVGQLLKKSQTQSLNTQEKQQLMSLLAQKNYDATNTE